jgi:hypothetical protein
MDRRFLAWFEQLLDRFDYSTNDEYRRYSRAINAVNQVCGYREYRTPTMTRARYEAERILADPPTFPDSQPPSSEPATPNVPINIYAGKTVSAGRNVPIINRLAKLFQIW